MQTIAKIRLWRVDLVSKFGYQAPSQLVEAKSKEVHKVVQNLNLRLLDFPKSWSYQLTDTKREFNSKKGKWI